MLALSWSMRASIRASRAASWGVKNSAPSSAASSSLILRRARARASWASTLGLRSPAIRWSMMSRPVTPCRSVTTLDSLIAADSSSFSARCFSRVRSAVRSRRYRVCSRMIRNSGVATKQEVMAPRSKHAASHRC